MNPIFHVDRSKWSAAASQSKRGAGLKDAKIIIMTTQYPSCLGDHKFTGKMFLYANRQGKE